jgi:DNA polymerase III epsilon subunit-like protein
MRPSFFGFDVETTGLDPQTAEIISIAMTLLSDDLTPIASETIYAFPDHGCPAEAAAVNGYDEELWRQRGAVNQRGLFDQIRTFTAEQRQLIPVGHNVRYDMAMLEALFKRMHAEGPEAGRKLYGQLLSYHSVDTVSISMFFDMVMFGKIASSYKLVELTKRFGISHETAHDAASDVRASIDLFRHLFKTLGGDRLNVPAPEVFSRMMIKQGDTWMINGGKKKGRTVLDVAKEDVTYIDWMLRKLEDLSPEQRAYLTSIRNQVNLENAATAALSNNQADTGQKP